MQIDFRASERGTLGVEWELQFVDLATGALAPVASEVIGGLGRGHPGDSHPRIRHELMESTVEIVTDVCDTVPDAVADLGRSIAELEAVLEPRGLGLACAGSHPFSDWREARISPGERYQRLIDDHQWLARRIQTFGVHVHVGVRSPDKAVAIVGALTTYLPHLLALSSSSPYWCGEDTGLHSVRSVVFGDLPTAGPPPALRDWESFEDYMAVLLRAGSIHSIKEVWWDIRPHPDFGTVELRAFDGLSSLREVAMAAALAQSLVERFDSQLERGYRLPLPQEWRVRENKWRAARCGLTAEVIVDGKGTTRPLRDELEELASELAPVAERLGCVEELDVVHRVLREGTSTERQRAVVAAGGDLRDVVRHLRAEFVAGEPLPVAG